MDYRSNDDLPASARLQHLKRTPWQGRKLLTLKEAILLKPGAQKTSAACQCEALVSYLQWVVWSARVAADGPATRVLGHRHSGSANTELQSSVEEK